MVCVGVDPLPRPGLGQAPGLTPSAAAHRRGRFPACRPVSVYHRLASLDHGALNRRKPDVATPIRDGPLRTLWTEARLLAADRRDTSVTGQPGRLWVKVCIALWMT